MPVLPEITELLTATTGLPLAPPSLLFLPSASPARLHNLGRVAPTSSVAAGLIRHEWVQFSSPGYGKIISLHNQTMELQPQVLCRDFTIHKGI